MPSSPTISYVNVSAGYKSISGIMSPGSFYLLGTASPGDTIRIFDAATGNPAGFPLSNTVVFSSGQWKSGDFPGSGYPAGLASYYAVDTTTGLRSDTVTFLDGTSRAETLSGPTLGATVTGPTYLFGLGGKDVFNAYTVMPDATGAHASGARVVISGDNGSTVALPIRLGALTAHSRSDYSPSPGVKALTLDTADARVQLTFTLGTLQFDDASLTIQTDTLADFLYYDQRYPDLAAADVNARAHYDAYGWREGRDPNADFSTRGYLGAYGDVRTAGLNPLSHYDANGWKEGRDPSALFDTRLYLLFNPDVARAGVDPLRHYLADGLGEGRKSSPVIASDLVRDGFDPLYYALANPDVSLSGMDAQTHWLSFGAQEGRNPDSFFDTNFYLAHNPDVAAAGVNALDHYNQYGWREGRDPSSHFHTVAYRGAYADVAQAGVNPLQHFLQYGAAEGRSGFGDLY